MTHRVHPSHTPDEAHVATMVRDAASLCEPRGLAFTRGVRVQRREAVHEPGHGGLLLVCGNWSNVIEVEDAALERYIARSAADFRFETAPAPVEVRGICNARRQHAS